MTTGVRLLKPGVAAPCAADICGLREGHPAGDDTGHRTIQDLPPPSGLTLRDMRRMAPLTRFALYAADQACIASSLTGHSADICLGITHGTTSYLTEFHDYLFDHGPEAASPNAFSNGVNNAALGAIARHLGLSGRGTTIMGYEQCGLDVLEWAAAAAAGGTSGLCYAGGAEEYSPLVHGAYRACGWYAGAAPDVLPFLQTAPRRGGGAALSEGSVFFPMVTEASGIASDAPGCRYRPLQSIESADMPVDMIISCAGGGPQDEFELDALTKFLKRGSCKPCVVFPKSILGETFAAGGLFAAAVGWDILVNHAVYPVFPFHESLIPFTSSGYSPQSIRSILVVAGSRDGVVSAGVMGESC